MKRFFGLSGFLTVLFALPANVSASDAETSATAGRGGFRPGGQASATARYEGDIGFARTDTRSGRVSFARGVAVGVDEDGLSLSVSHAVAPRRGPAVGGTFSLSIGRDGQVARNSGFAVAEGPFEREVAVGGRAGSGRFGSTADGFASGRTDAFGRVRAGSDSRVTYEGPRAVRRIRH